MYDEPDPSRTPASRSVVSPPRKQSSEVGQLCEVTWSCYPIMKLASERAYFKPFDYPTCYDQWEKHEHAHWSFKELNMQDDMTDWANKLEEGEKTFLVQILRYFSLTAPEAVPFSVARQCVISLFESDSSSNK